MSDDSKTPQDDCATGYGRPPRGSRFKPGQSGNPKGRPKGAINISNAWEKELNAPMVVTEGGRRKKIRKGEAVVKRVINKGVEGDLKAATLVLSEQREREQRSGARPGKDALQGPADQLVIANIVARIRGVADEETQCLSPPSDGATASTESVQGSDRSIAAVELGQIDSDAGSPEPMPAPTEKPSC